MFTSAAIQRVAATGKLPPVTQVKWMLANQPTGQQAFRRRITVLKSRPRNVTAPWDLNNTMLVPGHGWLGLPPTDVRLARRLAEGRHTLVRLLGLGFNKGSGILSFSPDPGSSGKVVKGPGYSYYVLQAREWHELPTEVSRADKETDIGNLRVAHGRLLLDILEKLSGGPASGIGKILPQTAADWTLEAFEKLCRDGTVPSSPLNPRDFLALVFETLARYEAPGTPLLAQFQFELAACAEADHVADLAVRYFRPDAEHYLSFGAPTPAPEPTLQSALEAEAQRLAKAREAAFAQVRKQPNFAALSAALGQPGGVIEAIGEQMHADEAVFWPLFADGKYKRWGVDFFTHLGEGLRSCDGRGGMAAVCYHARAYDDAITLISLMAFAPDGSMTICNPNVIELPDEAGAPTVRGQRRAAVCVPAARYGTSRLHAQMHGAARVDTPVQRSIELTGMPMVKFVRIADFAALREFNNRLDGIGASMVGLSWLLNLGPSVGAAELAAGIRSGKVPLTQTLLDHVRNDALYGVGVAVPAPGARGDFVAGLCANHSLRSVLQALKAGQAEALHSFEYCESMDLADAGEAMHRFGLMPRTDPKLFDTMRRSAHVFDARMERVEPHFAPYLIFGEHGCADAAAGVPGSYAPDVDCDAPHDPTAEATSRQQALARHAQLVTANELTFIDLKKVKPLKPSPWVARVLDAADHDLAVEHVKALSADDRELRFCTDSLDDAIMQIDLIFDTPSIKSFGVFDKASGELVCLGAIRRFDGFHGLRRAEVALSVLPTWRKKGVASFAMHWATCAMRNRGILRLMAKYFQRNAGTAALLKAYPRGQEAVVDDMIDVETTLPPADGDSKHFELSQERESAALPPHKKS